MSEAAADEVNERLERAEALCERVEELRVKLEETEDPDALIELLTELSEVAKQAEGEISAAKRAAERVGRVRRGRRDPRRRRAARGGVPACALVLDVRCRTRAGAGDAGDDRRPVSRRHRRERRPRAAAPAEDRSALLGIGRVRA